LTPPLPANDARLLLKLADLLEGSGSSADFTSEPDEVETGVTGMAGH
jgi:hypothetical protein